MIRTYTLIFSLLLLSILAHGQTPSTNTVKYRVGYDAASGLYTAYVIPDYPTPNTNNPLPNEFASTAQFTLVVPRSFSITDIAGV